MKEIMPRLFSPFGFGFRPEAYVGEVKKICLCLIYEPRHMRGLLPQFWRESRPNGHHKFKKKHVLSDSITTSHIVMIFVHTPASTTVCHHHHLWPPHHVGTASWRRHSSCRRRRTTFLHHYIRTENVKPPTTEPPLAKSRLQHTHIDVRNPQKGFMIEEGEENTYKRDWTTTMKGTLQPLWQQQWRRLVRRQTDDGETKLQLCGRRNLYVL